MWPARDTHLLKVYRSCGHQPTHACTSCALLLSLSLVLLFGQCIACIVHPHQKFFDAMTFATCRCKFHQHFRTARSCRRGPIEVLEHFPDGGVCRSHLHMYVLVVCVSSPLVSLALLFCASMYHALYIHTTIFQLNHIEIFEFSQRSHRK